MIRRLSVLLLSLLMACTAIHANEELNITLDLADHNVQTIELPYGLISFSLIEYGNNQKVHISVENTTRNQAILIFKNNLDEPILKKDKPKITFEKKYPGTKNRRRVYGCRELTRRMQAITPSETISPMFSFEASSRKVTTLQLPVYLAKYKEKQLLKKGAYNIDYTILSEDILTFNITIKGWTENNPEYIATKRAVDDFIRSVNNASFCNNSRHIPSLSEQQRPYRQTCDSLKNAIILRLKNSPWMSVDAPFVAYTALLSDLEGVNLGARTSDCGKHLSTRNHSCNYCALSSQEIYHQLDDLYQQLRAGKISKDAALKKASALNTCYQRNNRRKKDSSYTGKISRFYSRIANY